MRLLTISAVLLTISVVGIVLAVRLLRSKSPAGRTFAGCLFLLAGCLLTSCYYLPWPQPLPMKNGTHPLGSYPSNKIQKGMFPDEVKAILGPPYEREKDNDRESWTYLIDPYGDYWFGVDFGPDRQVTSTYGN